MGKRKRKQGEKKNWETKNKAPATILLRFKFRPHSMAKITNQSEPAGSDRPFKRLRNQNKQTQVCRCQSLQEMSARTPTKIHSRKGRKPKSPNVRDYCRACKCSFKSTYGSLGSFVNVFKPTNGAELHGFAVASACEQSGINLDKSSTL